MFRLAILIITICFTTPLIAQEKSLSDVIAALADENSVSVEAASALVKQTGKSVTCQVASKEAQCIIEGDIIHPNVFVPSFHRDNESGLQIGRQEWSHNDQFGIVQVNSNHDSWLPIESVESADAAANDIRELADSHELFACWEHHCQLILSVRSGEHQIFAECSTIEIDGLRGLPRRCSPVLFESKSKTWIKALTEYRFEEISPSAPISESLAVRAAKSLGISEETLIQAVDTALSKNPFIFEKRSIRGGYNSLLAVANPRPSKVLPGGWFEWPTVQVNPSNLTLFIDCDLLVNKYNTTEPTDWHQPTQAQQTTYCNALFQQISEAVESVCKRLGTVTKQGTNGLECNPDPLKVVALTRH